MVDDEAFKDGTPESVAEGAATATPAQSGIEHRGIGSGWTRPKVTLASLRREIESRDQDSALARANSLVTISNRNYVELGGLLARIRENHWYAPHASFKAYVETELAITDRQARYHIRTYEAVVRCSLEWPAFKDVGWSKMRHLAPILTAENAAEWLETAKGCSRGELSALIAKHQSETSAQRGGVAATSARKASQRSDPVLTSDNVLHLQPAVRRPTPLQQGEADDLLARLRMLEDSMLAALLGTLLAERSESEARDLIEALAARRGLTVSFEPR